MPNSAAINMAVCITMSKFVVEFGTDGLPPAATDGRLDAPAFHRNQEAIWSAIAGFLDGKTDHMLEIGSGTGQHAVTFARQSPQLTWWPSDILPSHLDSIAAWRREAGLANLRSPQRIDLMDPDWVWTGDAGADKLTAILCINVLHISLWRVAQNLIAGAGRYLRDGGHLLLYGPFMRDGAHTAPSNAAFDASLRARNPDWGVRDITDLSALARSAGLTLVNTVPMPANNMVLAFERRLQQK
jgi:SAM-dependent methyltransferase